MAFRAQGAGYSFAAASTQSGLDQTSSEERLIQKKALDDILGVLLSAGYFRARIPTLAPFDKVVGGLCWAISSSGAAVDVDLFYDEELALGQKIQLCEVIVKVLRVMQCPSPLQAHQIQGGDFLSVFPVVQWLIKKVLEYRKVTGDTVRMASESAFHRAFAQPSSHRAEAAAASYGPAIASGSSVSILSSSSSAAAAASAAPSTSTSGSVSVSVSGVGRTPQGTEYAASVEQRYQPQRRYRKLASLWSMQLNATARVQSCLLEFGERTSIKAANAATPEEEAAAAAAAAAGGKTQRGGTGTDFERKFAALQRAAKAEEEEARKQAMEREKGLLQQMAEAATGAKSNAVSTSSLGAFVDLQSEELRRAAEEYRIKEEELRALAESGGLLANSKLGQAAAHARRMAALQRKLEAADKDKGEEQGKLSAILARVEELKNELLAVQRSKASTSSQVAALDAEVDALPEEEKAKLKQLFDLQTRRDALQSQIAEFKDSCRRHLLDLQQRLKELEEAAASGEAAKRLAEMQAARDEGLARLEKAKALLSEKNREIDRLQRLLDDIPTRAELLQYERRFTELYDEVASKLEETRKYFALYNTLNKKKEFMLKEEELITSMITNFTALKSKSTRQSYLDQCGAFVSTVEELLSKQTALVDTKKAQRDVKAAEHQRLLDAQRSYYKAVKEFQEACDVNEALTKELNKKQRRRAKMMAEGGGAGAGAGAAHGEEEEHSAVAAMTMTTTTTMTGSAAIEEEEGGEEESSEDAAAAAPPAAAAAAAAPTFVSGGGLIFQGEVSGEEDSSFYDPLTGGSS